MRAFSLSISYLLLSLALCFSFSCQQSPPKQKINRGIYYWRSTFQLATAEKQALQALAIKQLYVKFFDVEWDELTQQPQPVATVRFKEKAAANTIITPVVFITNETLQQADTTQVSTLAKNLTRLLTSIISNNQIPVSNEIQIDCDWTVSTKDKYFSLLQQLREQPLLQQKVHSATIRLHQLKFINQTGIPPVDKGLLMCYNMGNLRHPQTGNSIIETAELDKYIRGLRNYPLHLDIALPLIDWYVWFSGNEYKGLFYPQQLSLPRTPKKITFARDTVINGYALKKGDWLRYENSPLDELEKVAQRLKNKLPSKERTILLYHLDEKVLSKYQNNELKNLFDRFY